MSRWLRVAEDEQYRTIVVTEFDPIIKSELIIGRYKFPILKGDGAKYSNDAYVDSFVKNRYSGEDVNWYDESKYLESKKQKELEEEKAREEIRKLWETPEGKSIWSNIKSYKEAEEFLKIDPDDDEYAIYAWRHDPAYESMEGQRDLAYYHLINSLLKTTNPIFQKVIEEKIGCKKEEVTEREKEKIEELKELGFEFD